MGRHRERDGERRSWLTDSHVLSLRGDKHMLLFSRARIIAVIFIYFRCGNDLKSNVCCESKLDLCLLLLREKKNNIFGCNPVPVKFP